MIKKKGLSLLVVAAVALLTAAAAGAKQSATILNGAGSTFVSPLVSTWTPASARPSTTRFSTARVGSGGGIPAITNRSVDFGASDAPLTPDQFTACNGCVQIPWALAGTAMAYNVPGAAVHLHLSGDVIAKIYMGQITNWNDPAIAALNKGATFPDLKITPVYRTGNSGTTYNFTDYLSSVSPTWKSQIGRRAVGQLAGRNRRERLGRRRRRRREHTRCDLLRRYRLCTRESPAFRGDPERRGQLHLPEHPQHRRGRRRDHDGAGRQRAAHREPAEDQSRRRIRSRPTPTSSCRSSRRTRRRCARWSSGR